MDFQIHSQNQRGYKSVENVMTREHEHSWHEQLEVSLETWSGTNLLVFLFGGLGILYSSGSQPF